MKQVWIEDTLYEKLVLLADKEKRSIKKQLEVVLGAVL